MNATGQAVELGNNQRGFRLPAPGQGFGQLRAVGGLSAALDLREGIDELTTCRSKETIDGRFLGFETETRCTVFFLLLVVETR